MDKIKLGDYIKGIREAKGLSQSEVETLTKKHGYKVDQGTLSKIESNETANPGLKAILGLSKALKVDVMKFILVFDGKDPDTLPEAPESASDLLDALEEILKSRRGTQ